MLNKSAVRLLQLQTLGLVATNHIQIKEEKKNKQKSNKFDLIRGTDTKNKSNLFYFYIYASCLSAASSSDK